MLLAAIGSLAARQIRSPAQIAADTAAPAASRISVPVERRALATEVTADPFPLPVSWDHSVVNEPTVIVWLPFVSSANTSSSYSAPRSKNSSGTGSALQSGGTCTS